MCRSEHFFEIPGFCVFVFSPDWFATTWEGWIRWQCVFVRARHDKLRVRTRKITCPTERSFFRFGGTRILGRILKIAGGTGERGGQAEFTEDLACAARLIVQDFVSVMHSSSVSLSSCSRGLLAAAEAQKFCSFLCWVEPVFGGTRFLAGVKLIPHSRDELQARFTSL
jgi:hypothetical protein